MKNFFALFLAAAIGVFTAGVVQAQAEFPAAGTVVSNANVRSGPGTGNAVVTAARAGQAVTVTACNADCSWYQIGTNQWIAAFLVVLNAADEAAEGAAQEAPVASGARAVANANLRSGPGTTYSVVGSTTANQALQIIGRSNDGGWYQLASGSWIFAELVTGAPADLPTSAATTSEPAAVQPAAVQPLPAAPQPAPAQPTPAPAAPPAQECDPNYSGACIPVVPYDLNCGDIPYKRFRVVGHDRHRFDGDKDGIACER